MEAASIRVLVSDSDAEWREALADELASQPDIELVGVADCADELTTAVSRTMPHVVVLDLDLTVTHGFGVLNKLKGMSPSRCPKTIICTGTNDEAAVLKAWELGAVDYLLKPCSPSAVVGRVRLHAYAEARKAQRMRPPADATTRDSVPTDRLMFLTSRYSVSELAAALSVQLGRDGLGSLVKQQGRLDEGSGPSASQSGFGERLLSLVIATGWFALLPPVCRVSPLDPMITMLLWLGVFVAAGKHFDLPRLTKATR